MRYGTCTCAYTATNAITDYTYDEFANLRRVIQPNSTQIDYDIDCLNRRIGKRINGQATQTSQVPQFARSSSRNTTACLYSPVSVGGH